MGDDEPRAAAGSDGGLPAWASRHLAEAGTDAATDSATTPRPAPGRHRHSGRREPSRLRGWALATAAVAAATGTVPLALSTLVREEAPMPRIGTFPVVAPADLGLGTARSPGGSGSSPAGTPGPDLAATLPPAAVADDPVVVPTARDRPLRPSPRRVETRGSTSADGDRPAPTTATPTSLSPAAGPLDPDDDEVGESTRESTESETPTPRESTTTTASPRRPAENRDADGERGGADREPSLLDSVVGTVQGVGGGLLG